MSDGQTPKFDSIYNDPSASTTLVSSDEVYFRVDPYPLKKGSTVFRDVLTENALREQAKLKAFERPWEAFCLASHLKDEKLAKHSLKLMAEDVNASMIRLEDMHASLAQQASMPYPLGLFKALMQQMHYSTGYVQRYKPNDHVRWNEVAEAFTPSF
ncbi:hypothetical protein V865_007225 [Kwoniella europaea PYCC6329]|uniref:Uncharacterized protein n=1 Tax=Kwoniella europaea PYCC6329 TaxID=1423913 RepID=A0AAX4KU47_9TREE